MIADIIVIVFILIMIYSGYRRGLVITVLGFLSFFISLFLAWTLYPLVSSFLRATPLLDILIGWISNSGIKQNLIDSAAGSIQLPGFFGNTISADIGSAVSRASDAVTVEIALLVLNVISIIVLFVLCRVIIFIITKILKIITSLPVIKQFDKLGGITAGALQGIIIVYAVFAVLAVIVPLQGNNGFNDMISESKISQNLYNHNIILNMFESK